MFKFFKGLYIVVTKVEGHILNYKPSKGFYNLFIILNKSLVKVIKS
jgi:hypothetical protein